MCCVIPKPFPDFPDHAWFQSELSQADSLERTLLKSAAETASQRNIAWHAILEACDSDLNGLELRQENREQYALILLDPSEPGRYRAQFYDARGFYGHITRDTPYEVFQEVFCEGFQRLAKGSLVALSQTSEWQRGSLVTNLIAEVNLGRISHSDMLKQLEQFDREQQVEAA